jgi:elongation factor G
MSQDLNIIRNIGVMAHIDAGKTTVTERILYFTGRTYKIGEVHDGTAVMDYLVEEQQRGITITSAATTCPWKGYTINLIDTPGHVDFTVEVERSLRVLDGAVAVFDASEGVQAQSETVWRQAQKYNVPCICLINKMDKVGADFDESVKSLREKLLASPVLLHRPLGREDNFVGFIDLLEMKALIFKQEKVGATYTENPIPEDYQVQAAKDRHDLIEAAAEFDEAVMEKYIHDQPVTNEQIIAAVRRGTVAGKLHPVLCGAALKSIGSQALLDAVVNFLPSPLDRPRIEGHKLGKDRAIVEYECDPNGPLIALAFKITSDQHGDLTFTRIYCGTIKTGMRVLNSTRDKKENVTRIFRMHAQSRIPCEQAQAGDIVALVGLKNTLTGDTLCLPKNPIQLAQIQFPEPVISLSIEPRSSADKIKLSEALETLKREDPTFKTRYQVETGQTIISGMGELHLEILQNKLIRDMKVDVLVGKPRVAYKETITQPAEGEGKFIKQTGGHGQYGHVKITIEPYQPGPGEDAVCIEDKIVGGRVPKNYIPSIIDGVMDSTGNGVLAGYPMINLKVVLVDGSYHPVDSSDLAFQQAGALAFSDAAKKARPALLEPIMKVQIITPEQYFGAVQGDLTRKRATIMHMEHRGQTCVIDAKVPLAEMFGYASELRGATQGRAGYTMEPECYSLVPEQISQKVLETNY